MLNSEVLDSMMERLGKRQASGIRGSCLRELNIALRELERGPTKPWFMEATATGTLTATQDYLELPANFVQEVEEGTFELQSSAGAWTELKKIPRDRMRGVTANLLGQFPEVYAIWGKRFWLGPLPDLAYAYRFDYYARLAPIADNATELSNDWLLEFFDYVTYKALIIVARDHISSDRLGVNFSAAYAQAKDSFIREVESRRVANETLLLTDEES